MLSKSVFAIALTIPSVAAAAPATSTTSASHTQAPSSAETSHAAHPHKDVKRRTALVSPETRARKDAHALPALPPPPAGDGHSAHSKDCVKGSVRVVAGTEEERFALAKCDGTAAPLAAERLSILVRPANVQHPSQSVAALAKGSHGTDLAPGVRRVDTGLVERLAKVAEHFAKPGTLPKVVVVSGYRPASTGSYHASARALDFRVDGVNNEALVAFCKTLPDTGCGYYPNSMFVHMDVRDHGTGHISWIDASAPGEAPRYVTAWPPAQTGDHRDDLRHEEPRHEEAREDARTEHPRADLDVDNIPAMPLPRTSDEQTAYRRK